jgi:hypothetical protein
VRACKQVFLINLVVGYKLVRLHYLIVRNWKKRVMPLLQVQSKSHCFIFI